MPTKTIYTKLLALVTSNLVLAGSILFIVILGSGFLVVRNQQASIERSTRASLVEKGTILIVNNSQALRGLVVDHAFSAIRELLSAAVKEDRDIHGQPAPALGRVPPGRKRHGPDADRAAR